MEKHRIHPKSSHQIDDGIDKLDGLSSRKNHDFYLGFAHHIELACLALGKHIENDETVQ